MQDQQYYKAVKASEPPRKDDWYMVKGDRKHHLYFKAKWWNGKWVHTDPYAGDIVEWLEPIPLPDAAVLRDKMQESILLLIEAHNELAKSTLPPEEYNPISGRLAQAKLDFIEIKESLNSSLTPDILRSALDRIANLSTSGIGNRNEFINKLQSIAREALSQNSQK